MISIPRLPFRDDKVFSVMILLTLIVPLVFYWGLYEKFEIVKLALWLILSGAGLILVFKQGLIKGVNKFFLFLIFAFIALGFLSAVFSISHINSFVGFYPRFTSGFLFYFLIGSTLWLLTSTLDKPRFEFLIKVLFFDALIIAVSGLLQTFGIGYYEGINQPAITRAPGLLGNPNFSSMFLAIMIVFLPTLFKTAVSFKSRSYYLISGFIMLMSIVAFSSRGTWLSLVGGLLFSLLLAVFLKFSKKTILIFFLGFCLGTGVIVLAENFVRPGTLAAALKLREINIDYRMFAWDVSRRGITENPFFGYGPGNAQIYFERFRESNLTVGGGVFDDVHNVFLQMALTTGLPFTLVFIGILSLGFWSAYKILSSNKEDLLVFCASTALVVWIIASSFNPVSTANFLLVVVILGGLLAQNLNSEIETKIPIFLKFLGQIAGLIMVMVGTAFIVSELIFFRSIIEFRSFKFEKSLNLAKTASKINPFNQLYVLYATANKIILKGDEAEFNSDLKKLIAMQPESAKTQVMAANVSYIMYDRTQDSKFLEAAISYMKNSLLMDKYFAPRYSHTAFYLAENNQLEESKEFLKAALSLDRTHLPSWIMLARIYQLQNKPAQSKQAIAEAARLRPLDEYLQSLNMKMQSEPDIKNIVIPATLDILQIEP